MKAVLLTLTPDLSATNQVLLSDEGCNSAVGRQLTTTFELETNDVPYTSILMSLLNINTTTTTSCFVLFFCFVLQVIAIHPKQPV